MEEREREKDWKERGRVFVREGKRNRKRMDKERKEIGEMTVLKCKKKNVGRKKK